jgi:hypothetical protein
MPADSIPGISIVPAVFELIWPPCQWGAIPATQLWSLMGKSYVAQVHCRKLDQACNISNMQPLSHPTPPTKNVVVRPPIRLDLCAAAISQSRHLARPLQRHGWPISAMAVVSLGVSSNYTACRPPWILTEPHSIRPAHLGPHQLGEHG